MTGEKGRHAKKGVRGKHWRKVMPRGPNARVQGMKRN